MIQRPRRERVAATRDDLQLLVLRTTNWNDHAPTIGKLSEQRLRNFWRRSRHEDGRKLRMRRQSECSISGMNADVRVAKPRQAFASLPREFSYALNGEYVLGKRGQHRSLIPASGANFKHSFLTA